MIIFKIDQYILENSQMKDYLLEVLYIWYFTSKITESLKCNGTDSGWVGYFMANYIRKWMTPSPLDIELHLKSVLQNGLLCFMPDDVFFSAIGRCEAMNMLNYPPSFVILIQWHWRKMFLFHQHTLHTTDILCRIDWKFSSMAAGALFFFHCCCKRWYAIVSFSTLG